MSAPAYTHRVYSDCQQAIAPGRNIYCQDAANAHRIASNIAAGLGGKAVTTSTEGGTYYYATQEDADADQTGMDALAVVYELTAEEIDALAQEAE